MAKRKPKKKPTTKPANIPAWTCPRCGATHPITVPTCCNPSDRLPTIDDFRPTIPPYREPPMWWRFPFDITCGVRP